MNNYVFGVVLFILALAFMAWGDSVLENKIDNLADSICYNKSQQYQPE